MAEGKRFECNKCPIFKQCSEAHVEVFGGVPVVYHGISTYEECRLYRMCRDAKDIKECIVNELEPEPNDCLDG